MAARLQLDTRLEHSLHSAGAIARQARGTAELQSILSMRNALSRCGRVGLIIVIALACLLRANAQSTFGSIRGTVQDASNAVIPNATVTVHSLDESFDRQALTNDSGEFVVENLKAGHYQVTVHHDGFSDAVVKTVSLEARQDLTGDSALDSVGFEDNKCSFH